MSRYDEQILQLDRELGRIFDELERRRLFERTWVFVVADHGEAFAEHGVIDHGSGVFEEIVHVPLIVFPPRGADLAPDSRPVSQVDVAATIAAIAGVEYDGPGRDLRVPQTDARVLIQHGAEPFRTARCGRLTGVDARAVINGKWKLLDTDGKARLFDLEADPGETLDRASELPELVQTLRELLPERMLRATPVGPGPDSDETKRLHGLGY
jgi:arylsulfatase A-like enzyme